MGEPRGLALLGFLTAAANSRKKLKPQRFYQSFVSALDFGEEEPEPVRQSDDQLKAALLRFAEVHNSRLKSQGKP